MKYKITTTLRAGIRDNAGVAVTDALKRLDFPMVENVRIGKVFYIETTDDIDKIAKELVNPVMEDFTIEEISQHENRDV